MAERSQNFPTVKVKNTLETLSVVITRSLNRFNGMFQKNLERQLIGWLIKSFGNVGCSVTKLKVKIICLFAFRCMRIFRNEGSKGLVLTLKTSNVLLQQASAGHKIENVSLLGRRIKRSRSGFPLWIPAIYRFELQKGNKELLTFLLSITSIYRILECPSKINLSSITNPGFFDKEFLKKESTVMEITLTKFWQKLNSVFYFKEFLKLKWRYFPINSGSATTTQTVSETIDISKDKRLIKDRWVRATTSTLIPGNKLYILSESISTTYWAIWSSARYLFNLSNLKILKGFETFTENIESGSLLLKNLKKVSDSNYLSVMRNIYSETRINAALLKEFKDQYLRPVGPPFIGRLGLKQEPAGKIRVFAMVDCWTQWLLFPLHKLIQGILRKIPEDATFDQTGRLMEKIEEMKGLNKKVAYSLDLSSATDRLPLYLQRKLLEPILGIRRAQAWADILVERYYFIKPDTMDEFSIDPKSSPLKYSVGQPMGALSSWVMLALTHHFIVQWAAYSVFQNFLGWKWFKDYIILGDDIVIFNSKVAKKYLQIMRALGVRISLHKSIISHKGLTVEFAKKFIYQGERIKYVPPRDLMVSQISTSTLNEFINKYSISFNTYLKLRDVGYKGRAKVFANFWNMPQRLRIYSVLYHKDQIEDWFMWIISKSRNKSYNITPKSLSLVTTFLIKVLLKLFEKIREMEFQENNRLMYNFESHYFHPSPELEESKNKKYEEMDNFSVELWEIETKYMDLLKKGDITNPLITLDNGNYVCEDESKAIAFIRDIYNQIEKMREKITTYPVVTFATQTRVDEDMIRFRNFISSYKEWVKLNSFFHPKISGYKKSKVLEIKDLPVTNPNITDNSNTFNETKSQQSMPINIAFYIKISLIYIILIFINVIIINWNNISVL
jgi:hypothetical protein